MPWRCSRHNAAGGGDYTAPWSSVDTARIGAVVDLGYIACSAVDVRQCPEQGLHDAALRQQKISFLRGGRWKANHNSSDRLLRGRRYWRLIAPLLKKDENNDLVVYILEMPGDVVCPFRRRFHAKPQPQGWGFCHFREIT